MFSVGGGESKSMRFAGVSVDVLMMDGPGVFSPAEVPPWAEVWEAPWAELWEVEDPVSELLPVPPWAEMWEVEKPMSELLPAFFLLLLLLCLRPLLGYSFVQPSE